MEASRTVKYTAKWQISGGGIKGHEGKVIEAGDEIDVNPIDVAHLVSETYGGNLTSQMFGGKSADGHAALEPSVVAQHTINLQAKLAELQATARKEIADTVASIKTEAAKELKAKLAAANTAGATPAAA